MKDSVESLQECIEQFKHELELMPKTTVLGRLCIRSKIKHCEKKIELLRHKEQPVFHN